MYHFIGLPHVPNLIRRGGLWCAKQLREWGDLFDDDRSKWGGWQKGEAFSGYISCSINPPMGMLTRRRQPVILDLNPLIAALPGVIFVGKWSSFKDVQPEDAVRQTGIEWFERMFLAATGGHANPHPGEFLVPKHIPLEHLQRIIFFSQEDLDAARRSLRGLELPPGAGALRAAVRPELFGTKMQTEEET